MTQQGPVVLILGSGPNVVQAAEWPKAWFDQILVINNAWRVRPDWDALVFPEDFDMARMPPEVGADQRLIEAPDFVPAQNAFGGFVYAGATMAYTTAYWALAVLKPRTLAFMGCDMMYPKQGDTHFYGTGTADPLRDDVTLRDLAAKSARLAVVAAAQGCACANLSRDPSSLLFARADAGDLQDLSPVSFDHPTYRALRAQEEDLGYVTPDGRYEVTGVDMNIARLDAIDVGWRELFDA